MGKLKTKSQLSVEDVRKLIQEYWETIESAKDSKNERFTRSEGFNFQKRNGVNHDD